MQKLELTINQTMGVINGNFEDIKKSLETEMAVYETKQFAEEDKQKAKGFNNFDGRNYDMNDLERKLIT